MSAPRPSPARFTAAAVFAGMLAAALLPGARAGLGSVLVAIALAGAAALAGRAPRRARSAGLGLLALALAAAAAVRDAGWVVAGELIAALVLGSIAMSAPRHWRATAFASVAAVLRMPSGGAASGRPPRADWPRRRAAARLRSAAA